MGVIEDFIEEYEEKYEYYERVGRHVREELEAALDGEGVRCLVTHRAKDISRLKAKCEQRAAKNAGYQSIDEIRRDIHDLAGVRVALYFPSDETRTCKVVERLFTMAEVKPVSRHPESNSVPVGRCFTGYSAVHYRVHLRPGEEPSSDSHRYARAEVEIQIASVLMHAWSEVEHDLVYKRLGGSLSEDELALLDQLNGLVQAGEISLVRLQKAVQRRIDSDPDRNFVDHFELAAHLRSHLRTTTDAPVTESEFGSTDTFHALFRLLTEFRIDTPSLLSGYLTLVHADLERRPLAQQVADAVIGADRYRFEFYRSVLAESSVDADIDTLVGRLVSEWNTLESLLSGLAGIADKRHGVVTVLREPRISEILTNEELGEIHRLRRLRNEVAHSTQVPARDYLAEEIKHIQQLISNLRKKPLP